MREDTKDLLAVTILIFFASVFVLTLLFTVAEFFLIVVAILGSIFLFTWALIRFGRMDR